MDVGETPTLLEVDWVFDTRWGPDLDDKGWGWEIMRTFWKRAPAVGSLPIFRLPLIPKSSMS